MLNRIHFKVFLLLLSFTASLLKENKSKEGVKEQDSNDKVFYTL